MVDKEYQKKENKFQREKGICFEKMKKTKRMKQAKRDTLWKEIETEEKWQKKHEKTDFTGKREMITKRAKQKRTKKKRPNKKKLKKNEQK